jgi:hypothetical protein
MVPHLGHGGHIMVSIKGVCTPICWSGITRGAERFVYDPVTMRLPRKKSTWFGKSDCKMAATLSPRRRIRELLTLILFNVSCQK